MSKYQIGEKYLLKIFTEPEEMEYLGLVKTKQLNGGCAGPQFEAFRRWSYGNPDLIALYDNKFFVRTYDNTVEGLAKAVGNSFRFEGAGYQRISIGEKFLSVEDFEDQALDAGVPNKIIEETILRGQYYTTHHPDKYGDIKWCPECDKLRHTSCCACGCGSCYYCGHRWCCYTPPDLNRFIK